MRYWTWGAVLLLCLSPTRVHAQIRPFSQVLFDGDVVDAAGKTPIGGARIRIQVGQREPLYARADAKGHFTFGKVAWEGYSVAVESPGYRARSSVPLSKDMVTESEGPDGLRMRVSIELVKAVVISGRVVDPEGLPVENCELDILRKEPIGTVFSLYGAVLPDGTGRLLPRGMGRTNERGEYRVGDLEPGTYYVAAHRPRYSTEFWENDFRVTFFPRSVEFAGAKPLELAAGEEVRVDIRVVRQKGVRVSGRIVMPPGSVPTKALPETQVALISEEHYVRNWDNPTAKAQDSFELTNVRPGRYTLYALTRDTASDAVIFHQKHLLGLARKIVIGERDLDGLELKMEPLREVRARVTFAEGCPASPVGIRTMSDDNFNPGDGQAMAGPDGRLVLQGVTVGRYSLFVYPPRPSESFRLGGRELPEPFIEAPFPPGEELEVRVGCYRASGLR